MIDMVTSRSMSATVALLRCNHCGRQVEQTWHTRTSYKVDYYSLYTGEVEEALIKIDDETPPISYQRLLSSIEVVTCVDCYRDPTVQRERERRFRPEVVGEEVVVAVAGELAGIEGWQLCHLDSIEVIHNK